MFYMKVREYVESFNIFLHYHALTSILITNTEHYNHKENVSKIKTR